MMRNKSAQGRAGFLSNTVLAAAAALLLAFSAPFALAQPVVSDPEISGGAAISDPNTDFRPLEAPSGPQTFTPPEPSPSVVEPAPSAPETAPQSAPPRPTAEQRAEKDWNHMTNTAEAAWTTAQSFTERPEVRIFIIGLAAALGAFWGARARSRQPSLAQVPSAPRALEGAPAPERLQEAERFFAFFERRFGVNSPTADSAIDYLRRLGASVDGLRKRAEDAERRVGGGGADIMAEAPWGMVVEAGLAYKEAVKALHGDAEYGAFARATELDHLMRRLVSLRKPDTQDAAVPAGLAEEAWTHWFLRADALAQTYYSGREGWRDLRHALSLGARALRLLLRRAGVSMEEPMLLIPISPADGEAWADSADGLRELAPVRKAVLAVSEGAATGGFAVDYESFGYYDAGRNVTVKSKLIVFNAKEWA